MDIAANMLQGTAGNPCAPCFDGIRHAGTVHACDAETQEQDIIERMKTMSQFPDSMCGYVLAYDKDTDEVTVRYTDKKHPWEPCFISSDDAYACILCIGESVIRRYYFGL